MKVSGNSFSYDVDLGCGPDLFKCGKLIIPLPQQKMIWVGVMEDQFILAC